MYARIRMDNYSLYQILRQRLMTSPFVVVLFVNSTLFTFVAIRYRPLRGDRYITAESTLNALCLKLHLY
jgi:hypothetical protein